MPQLELVRNDKGYDLQFTILDADENAVNLTNATIKLKVRKWNDTYAKFVGTCTITNAQAGQCKYTVTSTDFNIVGRYKCELEVAWGESKTMTATDLTVVVEEDIYTSG
jgi:hypothetical protein